MRSKTDPVSSKNQLFHLFYRPRDETRRCFILFSNFPTSGAPHRYNFPDRVVEPSAAQFSMLGYVNNMTRHQYVYVKISPHHCRVGLLHTAPGPARLTTGPKKRKKLDASCETVQRESTVEGRRENCAAKHVSAKVGMPVCSVTWISCDG